MVTSIASDVSPAQKIDCSSWVPVTAFHCLCLFEEYIVLLVEQVVAVLMYLFQNSTTRRSPHCVSFWRVLEGALAYIYGRCLKPVHQRNRTVFVAADVPDDEELLGLSKWVSITCPPAWCGRLSSSSRFNTLRGHLARTVLPRVLLKFRNFAILWSGRINTTPYFWPFPDMCHKKINDNPCCSTQAAWTERRVSEALVFYCAHCAPIPMHHIGSFIITLYYVGRILDWTTRTTLALFGTPKAFGLIISERNLARSACRLPLKSGSWPSEMNDKQAIWCQTNI